MVTMGLLLGGGGFNLLRHLLHLRMHVRGGDDFIGDRSRFVVLAGQLIGRCQAHLIGVLLGVQFRRALEFGDRDVVLLAGQFAHADAVVCFGLHLFLDFGPLFVRDLRVGLGARLHSGDGIVEVLVGLGELLFAIQIVLTGAFHYDFTDHHLTLEVFRVGLQQTLREDLGLGIVALNFVCLGFQEQRDFFEIS